MQRIPRSLAAALLVLLPVRAAALFHFSVIQEIQTSLAGDTGVQFVEIRMLAGSQNFVTNTVLGVFDTSGTLTDDYVVPGDVVSGGSWLMASAGFEAAAGIAPDFVFDVVLPESGGMVCWGAPGVSAPNPASWDHTVPSNYTDCIAYGSYAGPSNAFVGTPTPADPAGHSLDRISETHDNASDFVCADPATPKNNAAQEGALAATTPCPSCPDGVVDAGEECDDGNTNDCDACSNACLVVACGDGVLQCDEECDDANTTPGDGCDVCVLECGNGALDPGEDCDDGNRLCGDACDASCTNPLCGDGIVQCGEFCDDGNTVVGDGCEACQFPCSPLTRDESGCIVAMNRAFAGVWKAASQVGAACLRAIAKGKEPASLAACTAADGSGKWAKAEAKTEGADGKCTGVPSLFGRTDAPTVNAAAGGGLAAALDDVFGAAPIADAKAERDAARCQQEVVRALAKLSTAGAKAVGKAKKAAFKGKSAAPPCTPSDLGEAIVASLVSEKLEAAAEKAAAKIGKKCPTGDLSAWFATGLDASSAAALADGALERTRCRLCLGLEAADAVDLDCDAADDGATNGSC